MAVVPDSPPIASSSQFKMMQPPCEKSELDLSVPAALFVNPSAGRGAAARMSANVAKAFAQRNYPIQITHAKSKEAFTDAVHAAIIRGCTTLIAMGGDGTLQLLARETLGRNLKIGVIPAGGGNDFAAALGIYDWHQAVAAIISGKSRAVDLVRVAFADGTETFYLGGGGIGL